MNIKSPTNLGLSLLAWLLGLGCGLSAYAQDTASAYNAAAPAAARVATAAPADGATPAAAADVPQSPAPGPLQALGAGDIVHLQVYGQPDFSTTAPVGDDGTITVPLVGPVHIAGLSAQEASSKVAAALRDGQFLVNPQVTILVSQNHSQQVSVLGDVRNPSRFAIESRTTIFDLLAQAGGITDTGGDVVYIIRSDGGGGHVTRLAVDLKGLGDGSDFLPTTTLRAGDVIFVPHASHFYIYGEVTSPNMYKLERGMTVLQAISRSGGITQRGSDSRIEIKRHNADGSYTTTAAHLSDPVQADDVIRVKERIF